MVGNEKIYISTTNGRLLIADLSSGKTETVLKIDNDKILRPIIFKEKLFIVKDNAIIKLK